ncbi:hypothetical protein [Thermodesulfovibrio sp. 3462-1]|uniref:Uncharacterized protein n=1 Tax=Thermodesulfovibrio obliviosus TaxID=3118332 RepID=A0AAU8H0D4_9BACT
MKKKTPQELREMAKKFLEEAKKIEEAQAAKLGKVIMSIKDIENTPAEVIKEAVMRALGKS